MTDGGPVDPARVDTIGPAGRAPRPLQDRRMLEALVCPLTQGTLSYDAEACELVSRSANLAFPIRDGIPIMLVAEARSLD